MERSNNFDALRLIAATSVILSHAFLLSQGRQDNEPLVALTGGQAPLGVVGVFVFFVISGFLVTQSYETTGSPLRYAAKRALRIYPGLAVCILLCAFVLGPLVTHEPLGDYLRDRLTYNFLLNNLWLNTDHNTLPGVGFTRFAFGAVVDGPLWTLPAEVVMYAMVLVLGLLRLLRLAALLPLLAVGLVCLRLDTAASGWFIGTVSWLLAFFVAGMILYKLRRLPIFSGRIALAALIGLVASVPLGGFIVLFPLFGAYLVIYLARERRLPVVPAARCGDLSYGLYIYGWPVEQTLLYLTGGALAWWQLFPPALAVSAAIAFLSWHLIEKRALRLKPRGVAMEGYAAPV
ncbi:MAG TPA: acyltransferase [Stellaceae bacterium]|nr:acyltransferase [Stellaceae bacterium]